MLSRRGFIGGMVAALATPYVVRDSGLLMPVRQRLVRSDELSMMIGRDPISGRWRALSFAEAIAMGQSRPSALRLPEEAAEFTVVDGFDYAS